LSNNIEKNMHAIKVCAVLSMLAASSYGQAVFAELFEVDMPDPPQPVFIGTIPGTPGMYIHILELGIGGEPDAFSGPTIYSGIGSGLDFSWGAGQSPFSATYVLDPTSPVAGPPGARGFTYQDVSLFSTEVGGALDIRALSSEDSDGLFTYATDARGTFFDDSATPGSSRVWLSYEYTTVPEPSTWALFGVGGALAFVFRRKWRS
jgi:hypothetical protein